MKVLLVEDNMDSAHALSQGLRILGCDVETVSTVANALAALIEGKFDVIISDVGLPDGHGIGLMHSVRAFCTTPAIALTAFGSEADVSRCLEAGFDVHIAKPSQISTLYQEMLRLVNSASSREEAPGQRPK